MTEESRKFVVKKESCIVCGGSDLVKYLSLGETALANSYLSESYLNVPELKAPLEVYYCKSCHLAQLLDIVDRNLLFRNYAYFSSTSPQLLTYFDQYAEEVVSQFLNQSKKLVFEIASNDGILLLPFQKRGSRVLGMDPARNIAEAANKNGIETIPEFFNSGVVSELISRYGKAGIITANNVLAHTDTLHEIIEGVKQFLDEEGVFVFECQYFPDLYQHNEFDNTYHEHICYYSLLPLVRLLEMHSLSIFDVKHTESQGGSVRVYTGHAPLEYPVSENFKNMLQKELDLGFDKVETYLEFAKRPEKVKKDLPEILKKIKAEGKIVAGYGAPAKGNTLLEYCGIGPDLLDYIIDYAPSKQGKYTPGSHIPIYPQSKLKETPPDYILLLAWNYGKSIVTEREKEFSDRGGKYILPIPEPKIIDLNFYA